MTNLPVYYNNTAESVPVTPSAFLNAAGTPTDPSSISCVVTDPSGTATTYTYNGSPPNNTITRSGTGVYNLSLSGLTVAGLYTYVWIGTGNGVGQVNADTFRLIALNDVGVGRTGWYVGLEELKSRNSVPQTNHADDYEWAMAISAASGWINRYCGQHFYPITEVRTFPITNIYYLPIDPVVPGSITEFAVDYNGDGVYDTIWTEGANYQLYRQDNTYNINDLGVARPFDLVKVILGTPVTPQGGEFFPFVWPFTQDNRVQITATWGWAAIPPEVTHACTLLATQLFKEKDSPWGIAGVSDLGAVRVQASPWIADMLRPYRDYRKVVGV